MSLTNAGRDHIAQAIAGEAPTPFNAANAYIGMGSGNAVFAAGQTDLQGASKTRKAMDATYPQRTDNVITYRATFGLAEGNHAVEEWALFNAAAAGTMLQRKVESLGTKTSVMSWQITVDLTVAAA